MAIAIVVAIAIAIAIAIIVIAIGLCSSNAKTSISFQANRWPELFAQPIIQFNADCCIIFLIESLWIPIQFSAEQTSRPF